MKQFGALLSSVLLLAALSCGQQVNIGVIPPAPASITVVATPPNIPAGNTSTLTAQLVDGNNLGNVFITDRCQWASSNTAVATISGSTAKGISAGTSTMGCTLGSLTGSVTLTVSAPPLITNPTCATPPCALPNGTNGVAYSFTFAATGGKAPYSWSLSVGNFNSCLSGVSFTAGGVLTGTGTTNVCTPTVQVTDSNSASTTLQVSLTITASASCGTLPNYCARSDSAVVSGSTVNGGNPPATLIGLNHAGNCVLDDMNSGPAQAYNCAVTDYALVGTSLPLQTQMFTVPSSSTSRAWNSATGVFATTDTGGGTDFFSYTAGSPPATAFLGRTLQEKTGIKIAQPDFSTTNALTFYSVGSAGGTPNPSTINSYLQDGTVGASSWTSTHLTGTVLLTPTNCPGLSTFNTGNLGTSWTRYLAANLADGVAGAGATPAVIGDARFQQDQGSLVIAYDPSQGSSPHCAWVDLKTGQYCNFAGTCGSTTGFGPVPAPLVSTLTSKSASGSLIAGHVYAVQTSYTIVGNGTYGGESTPSAVTTLALAPFTNAILVSAPIAQPGGGTGLNLTETATGFNVYMCDQTASPGCTPTLQTNGTNASGVLAQPVITSITGCTAGSTSYTYYLVARNSGGASVTSAPVVVNSVTSNFAANNCTANFSQVTNATAYDLELDSPTMRIATGTGACSGGVCSLKTSGSQAQYVNQTTPIGSTPTITSLTTTGPAAPTVNSAGVNLHNLRVDNSGQWVFMTTADSFAASQHSPVNAPMGFLWNTTNPSVLIPGYSSKLGETGTAPYVGYMMPHWTMGNGTIYTWPLPTEKQELVITPLNSSAATMNITQSFGCNGSLFAVFQSNSPCNLDTQSGDMHMSGNASALGVVTKTAYATSGYGLPSVPGTGEVDMWDITTGTLHRGCHTWDSGQSTFNSTPRGNVSQDGTVIMYASDMQVNGNGVQGTAAVGLGSTAGGTSCTTGNSGNCRYDVYICQLK